MNSRSSRSGRDAGKSKRQSSNSKSSSRSSHPNSSTTRSRSKPQASDATASNTSKSARPSRRNGQPHAGTRAGSTNGNGNRKGQSTTHRQATTDTDQTSRHTHGASAHVRPHHEQTAQRAGEHKSSPFITPANLPPVHVLYEDNHVIGVVKPVNIPSQADDTGDMDMLTLIKHDLKQRHQKEGNVFLGLIHRLDRPVGGAMLFAKTSKGASRLSDSVRKGKLGKRYVAVLRGIPSRSQATLRDTLLKDSRTNTSTVVAAGTASGKEAVLDYEVLATDVQSKLALVLIKLHTGRSHQIRVQMAHAGHPLFGDQRYGGGLNRPGEQLALWSVLASAPHPVKEEMVSIISLPPRVKPWTQWSETLYDQLVHKWNEEQE
ncbi:RluA family pseudouridine synthase [Paenibacillus wenxiniae]|uniref:RNA pseudouridylate synthase n=1 Tax=Paenibacillus wenxiniae TaxID=1636843 RepID=A0ABW4RDL7_9BACL